MLPKLNQHNIKKKELRIDGANLTIDDLMDVVRHHKSVVMPNDPVTIAKLKKSVEVVQDIVDQKTPIYGINTNFGGLANFKIENKYHDLQNNLIWGLKCAVGNKLPEEHIRASMLCRANALVKGFSGIRYELIERLLTFINANITPIVREQGSIGASGDLVPLAAIAGTILGLSDNFKATYQGNEIGATTAMSLLNLQSLTLEPKEGLALINGTSVMSGIAAINQFETERLFKLTLFINSMFFQALSGDLQSLNAFVHNAKPHPGQIQVARLMRELLSHSKLTNNKDDTKYTMQDRYSIRCLAQYLGVISDNLINTREQIEIEINSATDNPLIDSETASIYHSGNFLGQYIGHAMDTLRYSLGLMAKHLDTQIALLVTPEFSNGLTPSLIADRNQEIKFGLKGLQICANSIMPELLHLGQPIVHLFPTHAEQFNQNINSLGFSAANLASKSVNLYKHYCAAAIIFAIHASQLRSFERYHTYNVSNYLSAKTKEFYQLFYEVIGEEEAKNAPLIKTNVGCDLELYLEKIHQDLCNSNSKILSLLDNVK